MPELWARAPDVTNRKLREVWARDNTGVNRKQRELWARDGAGVNRKIFSGYDCIVQNLSPDAGSMAADGSAVFTFARQDYQRYIPMLHFTFSDPITFTANTTAAMLSGCAAGNDSQVDYTMYRDSAHTKAVARSIFQAFSGSNIYADFTATDNASVTEIWLGVIIQAYSESFINWGSGALAIAGKQIKSVQIV